jgi:hypothetical protein
MDVAVITAIIITMDVDVLILIHISGLYIYPEQQIERKIYSILWV